MPVIDTSVMITVLLGEAAAPQARTLLAGGGIHVPDILLLEVANALVNALRRGRITADEVSPRVALARQMRAEWHPTVDLVARATNIALVHHRRPYDGVFVALAEYLGQELITLDAALVRGLAGTPLAKRVRLLAG
jgi:predicted nucleic acid-binding protein